MTKRILVTGAQGFVGRFLVSELLKNEGDVRILGIGRSKRCDTFTHDISLGDRRVRAPLPEGLEGRAEDGRYEYASADIRVPREIDAIVEAFKPAVVYHMASGLRDDDPAHLFSTNAGGTLALVGALAKQPIETRMVIGSSGSVYGASTRIPIPEDEACDPRDVYAVSKLASEQVARIGARGSRLALIVARIFNIAGPGQEERHAVGRFASQVAAIASGSAPARLEVGDLTTTRDFIDVRDVARVLKRLAQHGQSGETYNVGSGVETPIGAILEVLLQATGLHESVRIDRHYVRAADIPRLVAEIGRLRSIGYSPSYSLQHTVLDVLAYYLAAMNVDSNRIDQIARQFLEAP